MITGSFDSATKSLTLSLQEDLLSSNAEAVAKGMEEQLAKAGSFSSLVVDLCNCQMVDSVGLNLLFTLLNRCKNTGASTKIKIAPGRLDRIMQVSQMGKLFEVEVRASQ